MRQRRRGIARQKGTGGKAHGCPCQRDENQPGPGPWKAALEEIQEADAVDQRRRDSQEDNALQDLTRPCTWSLIWHGLLLRLSRDGQLVDLHGPFSSFRLESKPRNDFPSDVALLIYRYLTEHGEGERLSRVLGYLSRDQTLCDSVVRHHGDAFDGYDIHPRGS